jgi:hypothetical protein
MSLDVLGTYVSETKETKTAKKRVVIALGIICIILAACLGGVVLAYTLMRPRSANPHNQSKNSVKGVDEQLGLQLAILLQKTDYRLGEPINITFTITNISNQTISLAQYDGDRFDFRVYNGTNHTVYESSLKFPVYPFNPGGPNVSWTSINAKESLTGVLVWGQTCNNTAFSEGVPVSTGTYYIVGQTGYIFNMNGLTIDTNPIQIVIAKPG